MIIIIVSSDYNNFLVIVDLASSAQTSSDLLPKEGRKNSHLSFGHR